MKKNFIILIFSIVIVSLLLGCAQTPKRITDEHGCITSSGYSWCNAMQKCIKPPEECVQPYGSDRDVHGCIGSAGYIWCDIKQKCIRPWEENCSKEISKDAHGCLIDDGEEWCTLKKKCLKPWEESCVPDQRI